MQDADVKEERQGEERKGLPTRHVLRLPSLSSFYLSPYLTCGECNSIAFINSKVVEKALIRLSEFEISELQAREQTLQTEANPESPSRESEDYEDEESCDDNENSNEAKRETREDILHGLELEALPRCPGCQRTHTWFVGALDLSGHIAGNAKERRRLQRLMHRCAIRIQAIVRGIRDRGRADKIREEKLALEALIFRSASLIAAAYRGHLDRRAARVERSLRRINGTHKIVMNEALKPRKGRRVFWYKRKEEIKLLHQDYRILVERTGNDPPLHIVESNIVEIAKRVHEIECKRAARIQCRVRGMIGRKFIRQYRIERSYVLALRCSAVFPIQRAVRMWRAYGELRKRRLLKRRQEICDQYQSEASHRSRENIESKLNKGVLRAYKHDVRVDKAGRMMVPGFIGNNSAVARSRHTIARVNSLQSWQRVGREEKSREIAQVRARADFCERKCEERSTRRLYFGKELEEAARVEEAAQGPIRRPGVTTASFMRELEKYRRTKSRVNQTIPQRRQEDYPHPRLQEQSPKQQR